LSVTKFLAKINKPTIQEKIADGLVLFKSMVEKYKAAHVEAEVAGRFLLAKPTRLKYLLHLEQRIVPQWGERRLREINPDEVRPQPALEPAARRNPITEDHCRQSGRRPNCPVARYLPSPLPESDRPGKAVSLLLSTSIWRF
jgi:hypothetical protein